LIKEKRNVIKSFISALEDRNLNNRNNTSSSNLVATTTGISKNSNAYPTIDGINANSSNFMEEDISNNWEAVSNNWED